MRRAERDAMTMLTPFAGSASASSAAMTSTYLAMRPELFAAFGACTAAV